MKRILFIISAIIFIGSTQLFADGDGVGKNPASKAIISGKVMDIKTGEFLTGVAIKIEGTDIVTYTDFDGNFEIDDLEPGSYNLVASYISYKNSLIEHIDAKAGTEKEIEIELQSSR